jgi:NAD(P)-dependent dehydrogenase (short-subunit alcohol dehydrogenase family)
VPATFTAVLPDVVVVTGTGSGLGLAVADLLASSGCTVIGVDLAGCPGQLTGATGYEHLAGDVTDRDTVESISRRIAVIDPGLLGLVTAAAVLDVAPAGETSDEVWQRTLHVNLMGTVAMVSGLLDHLRSRAGVIAAIASVDASFAEQQLGAYAASKAAVRQFIRTVALDHAREGIRANVVSPGPMLAGLFARHMASADDPERFHATRANRQPMGRILDVADVANVVAFAVSSASAACNGADLIVDGGLTTGFDFRTGEEGASV